MLSKSLLILGVLLAAGAQAKTKCPDNIKQAVQKDYPDAKVSSCKMKHEEGKSFYELKVKTSDAKKIDVDVNSEGKLIQAERKIKPDEVPAAVKTGFEQKHPGEKIRGAERQTHPDGTISYEVHFWDAGKKHEAVFKEDGSFIGQQ